MLIGNARKMEFGKPKLDQYPLKNLFICSEHNRLITASGSKSRNGNIHHYYHCSHSTCKNRIPKEKLEKYIDAVKGVTQAQRGLRDANKQVDESNKSLLEKTNALREAQRKFNLITNGYGKESKQAKDADNERSKAERAAERAKYALE